MAWRSQKCRGQNDLDLTAILEAKMIPCQQMTHPPVKGLEHHVHELRRIVHRRYAREQHKVDAQAQERHKSNMRSQG